MATFIITLIPIILLSDTETVENEDELINKQVLLDTKEGDTEDGTGQGSKLPDSTASEPPTPVAQAIYQSDKESGPNSHIIGIPRNDFFFISKKDLGHTCRLNK